MQRAVKQNITLSILVALAALAFAACSQTGSGSNSPNSTDPNAVAATVNGKPIMMKEVDTIISQQTQGQQAQMSPLELAAARMQVLDGLVQKEVLYQRADRDKLLPTEDEVTASITQQKQQSGMTDEEFQKRLKEQNQTEATLRDEVRKSIAIQRLQDKITSKISISDREVEDFYNNNKQQFVNARGVELAEIVADPADNGRQQDDAKSDTEAKQKIDLVFQQLKRNADFATVARERSEDQSAIRGGDIGFASEETLKQYGFPQELIGQLFGSMEIGSYTSPIQFNGGRWYIFKLKRRQLQNENLTLNSPGVRQDITQTLTDQRKQVLGAALIEVAMNEAKITNNLAAKMVDNPANLSGPRPASSVVPTPTPGASPQAATSPKTEASPSAKQSPAAQATPKK